MYGKYITLEQKQLKHTINDIDVLLNKLTQRYYELDMKKNYLAHKLKLLGVIYGKEDGQKEKTTKKMADTKKNTHRKHNNHKQKVVCNK